MKPVSVSAMHGTSQWKWDGLEIEKTTETKTGPNQQITDVQARQWICRMATRGSDRSDNLCCTGLFRPFSHCCVTRHNAEAHPTDIDESVRTQTRVDNFIIVGRHIKAILANSSPLFLGGFPPITTMHLQGTAHESLSCPTYSSHVVTQLQGFWIAVGQCAYTVSISKFQTGFYPRWDSVWPMRPSANGLRRQLCGRLLFFYNTHHDVWSDRRCKICINWAVCVCYFSDFPETP